MFYADVPTDLMLIKISKFLTQGILLFFYSGLCILEMAPKFIELCASLIYNVIKFCAAGHKVVLQFP
jgi:hypothetical protein